MATPEKTEVTPESETPHKQHPAAQLTPVRRKWAALCQLVAIGMTVLDASMINVGLPAIAESLGISASLVVWVVNAYGLTVVALLLPLSSVVERFGLQRMFTNGLALFLIGATISALSVNLTMLLAGRIIQGMGAASIFCLSATFIRSIYPPDRMSQGIGWVAMTVGVSAVVGPTIGAFLITIAGWRWLFAIMLPTGAFVWIIKKHLPVVIGESRPFDYKSAIQAAAGITCLILGLDFLVTYPWQCILLLIAAAIILVRLSRQSALQPAPLFPVDLLRIKPLRFAIAASHLSFSSQMAAFISLPFFLLNVLERDQMMLGILMGGWPAGAAVMAVVAGHLADRYSIPILCAIGAACMLAGLLALSWMTPTTPDTVIFLFMLLCGIGFGFFQTPNNRVLFSSGPRERLGALGGLQAVTRVFGQTVGAAIVASAFALSQMKGPTYGLVVAMVFAAGALALNVYRQHGLKAHETA